MWTLMYLWMIAYRWGNCDGRRCNHVYRIIIFNHLHWYSRLASWRWCTFSSTAREEMWLGLIYFTTVLCRSRKRFTFPQQDLDLDRLFNTFLLYNHAVGINSTIWIEYFHVASSIAQLRQAFRLFEQHTTNLGMLPTTIRPTARIR